MDTIVETSVYETDGKGGLRPISSEGKNALQPGQILHWGGNYGWAEEDFVIDKALGVSENFRTYGMRYLLISLKDYRYYQKNAYSIKLPTDDVWHRQHFFLEERELSAGELEDVRKKATEKKAADDAAKAQAERVREELIQRGKAIADRVIPDGTKALIIAEQDVNTSDSQIDYFSHRTTAMVILGCMGGKDG